MPSRVTWDQALFLFHFENYILVGKAKWKESLIQTLYQTSSADFFDWLTFAESANQNYFPLFVFLVCKFFIRAKNADSLTWKIAVIFKFFQLKITQSAQ